MITVYCRVGSLERCAGQLESLFAMYCRVGGLAIIVYRWRSVAEAADSGAQPIFKKIKNL